MTNKTAQIDFAPVAPEHQGPLRASDLARVGLLACIVLFEGFDVSITSVVLPYVARTMDSTPAHLGQALSAVALGSIMAVFMIRLADRFGRKPVLLLAAGGFAVGTFATAFVSTLFQYAAVQFVTRTMAVTQVALAYLIISESLPAAFRGRANGVIGAFGSLGAALPFILLERGLSTSWGWRSLFLLGATPILLLPLLVLFLRETPIYLSRRKEGLPATSWFAQIRLLWAANLRRRVVALSIFWLLLNVASMSATVFFTTYVVQERGWTPGDIAVLGLPILISAFAGNLLTGALLDKVGRRLTLTILLLALGLLSQIGYTAREDWIISACWIGIQASYGIWSAAFTYNAELFPTHLRATATGVCNNLIGRWGMVLAPVLVSALATVQGNIGEGVLLCSFAAYLAIPLLWFALPETKNVDLRTVH